MTIVLTTAAIFFKVYTTFIEFVKQFFPSVRKCSWNDVVASNRKQILVVALDSTTASKVCQESPRPAAI